jgi:hypothetical protein
MALVFKTLHRGANREQLNDEWFLLENTGPGVVTAQGCAITIARNAHDRPRSLGTLDPGFVLHPNEKIRLVTGTPSKKSHGLPPDEKEVKNYHLFLREAVLSKPGVVVRLALNQLELARAEWKPDAPNGIGGG